MDMARHTHKPIQARMHMHADPHTYKAVVEADWENPPTLTYPDLAGGQGESQVLWRIRVGGKRV